MHLHLTHESKDAIAVISTSTASMTLLYLNNFDIDRHITLDVEDKDDMLNDVYDLIDDHTFGEYAN